MTGEKVLIEHAKPMCAVSEIIGNSPEGWNEAKLLATSLAIGKLLNVTGVHVISETAQVQDGKIVNYRVTMKVSHDV